MNSTLSPLTFALLLLSGAVELGVLYWLLGELTTPFRMGEERHAEQVNGECIIVPLTDPTTCANVVEVACRLASDRQAEILLVHVLEIPLTTGLYVPLPSAEEKARHLLEAGERIAKQHNLKVESRILRHRVATEAILELASETGAEAIVTGTGAPPWWSFARIERTASELLRQAPCQVIVAKAPRSV